MMKSDKTSDSAGFPQASGLRKKELSVLMIGNSFSECVCDGLPPIVNESGDCLLRLTSLYIGGCSLEQHWNNVLESEQNPDAKQYEVKISGYKTLSAAGTASINEAVKRNDWDVISIQQASHESWDKSRFQPFAGNLIEFIRRNSPRAEIIIQQTWAYRNDNPHINTDETDSQIPNGDWGFSQLGMYKRLTDAYISLAEEYGFRIIPTGLAVQISRCRSGVKFDADSAKTPEARVRSKPLPPNDDVVGNTYSRWDPEAQKIFTETDTIHLNARGEYLQGCVWFGVLFNKNPAGITYIPDGINPTDAVFLRECAADAVGAELKRLDRYRRMAGNKCIKPPPEYLNFT